MFAGHMREARIKSDEMHRDIGRKTHAFVDITIDVESDDLEVAKRFLEEDVLHSDDFPERGDAAFNAAYIMEKTGFRTNVTACRDMAQAALDLHPDDPVPSNKLLSDIEGLDLLLVKRRARELAKAQSFRIDLAQPKAGEGDGHVTEETKVLKRLTSR